MSVFEAINPHRKLADSQLADSQLADSQLADSQLADSQYSRPHENDIMFLCTPQVVGKPDIGIEFTDRKTLLPCVTYRNIGQV